MRMSDRFAPAILVLAFFVLAAKGTWAAGVHTGDSIGTIARASLIGLDSPTSTAFPWRPVIPDNLGTQSGGGFDEMDAQAIGHELDARWLRIECGWTSVENPKGTYNFAGIEKLVTMLLGHGLEPIIIFDYGHPLYQTIDGQADLFCGPTTPEAQRGYAAFCGAVAAHLAQCFPKHVFVYELWNEPNFKLFWRPAPDAAAYTRLCKLAYPAIKKAAPDSVVMGPATSSATDRFIAECIDDGILDAVDAVSIHPYRHRPPETVIADYAALRKLIAARNEKDGKPARVIPLVSSEWGYSATPDKSIGISCDPKLQAPYLARMWLIGAWQDIGISIWFQWRGGSDADADPWSKFGMTRNDRTPRPSYTAAKTLIQTLRGYRCTGRIDVQDKDDYVLRFKNSETGTTAIAAWTTGNPHPVSVPWADFGTGTLVTMMGEHSSLTSKDGHIDLSLSPSPIYALSTQKGN